MAFEKKKDGAWMEPEECVERYDTSKGYWVECKAAKIYKNGAWGKIWQNIKKLVLLSNSITVGECTVEEDGSIIRFTKNMSSVMGQYVGSVSGGGTMVLYVNGKWTNPNISFDYSGGFLFTANGKDNYTSAGDISIYNRTTDGTVKSTKVVSTVGTNEGTIEGYYDETFNGTYDRLGLSVYVNGTSTKYSYADLQLVISGFKINGQSIPFPTNAQFVKN